jgi:hypothetical protein
LTFANCKNLEEVKIPESVIDIYTGAFRDCSELRYVQIPDGECRISEGAFFGSKFITAADIGCGIED